MKSFENARAFFHNCEMALGWEACKEYVAENAGFDCQSAPFAEVKTVKDYVDSMAGLGSVTMQGSSYVMNNAAFDSENNTALFFATFVGTHNGEGGPVPPTNKTTHSHYVFAVRMNEADQVEHITKIWNSSWAFKELGWM